MAAKFELKPAKGVTAQEFQAYLVRRQSLISTKTAGLPNLFGSSVGRCRIPLYSLSVCKNRLIWAIVALSSEGLAYAEIQS